MAGMFYSKQEAAEKLNITSEQIEGLVSEGKLREFRDGANVLFKVDEVEALMSGASIAASGETAAEPEPAAEPKRAAEPEPAAKPEPAAEPEPVVEPERAAEPEPVPGPDEVPLGEEATADTGTGDELLDADTFVAGQGVNVLGEVGGEVEPPAEDVLEGSTGGADEALLEEIEEDVNLDTFGSGSGLLDLSLQADDTSLGGILDEIYTAEEGQETREGSAVEASAEEEQIIPEEEFAAPEPVGEAPVLVQAYVEAEADTLSNAFGYMLFLPLLAILYTAIVAVAGFNNVMPGILSTIQGRNGLYGVHIIWYVMIGIAVVAGLIIGVAFMLSKKGETAGRKEKVKKVEATEGG